MDFINNSYELQYNSGLDSKYVNRFKRLIEQRKIGHVFNRVKRRKEKKKVESEEEVKVSVSEATFYYLSNDSLPRGFDTVIQYELQDSWEDIQNPPETPQPKLSLLELASSLVNSSTQRSVNEPFINYDSLKSIETFESIGTISTKNHQEEEPENLNSINKVQIQSIHKYRLPRLINFVKNRFHNT